jgi:hypothetical protein
MQEEEIPQGMDPPASEEVASGDDALLDLDQLEELHDEAERMKALGNKHMAAQVCLNTTDVKRRD